MRACVHSFVRSLRYSLSVNYLKILFDKFMMLIISMSPGMIQGRLIIVSTDRQQTRQWHVPICGVSQVKRTQSYRIKTLCFNIMTRLFANIPGKCCMTFCYPFNFFFLCII